jgi:hypothetical protein
MFNIFNFHAIFWTDDVIVCVTEVPANSWVVWLCFHRSMSRREGVVGRSVTNSSTAITQVSVHTAGVIVYLNFFISWRGVAVIA